VVIDQVPEGWTTLVLLLALFALVSLQAAMFRRSGHKSFPAVFFHRLRGLHRLCSVLGGPLLRANHRGRSLAAPKREPFMPLNGHLWLAAFALVVLPMQSRAAPACVNPGATNYVVASAVGDLTINGFGSSWILQNIDTNERIFLHRCSQAQGNTCYFAINVKPGKYYFQQAVAEGDVLLSFPVSTAGLWFPVTGLGVDYIGRWDITRDRQLVSKLQIRYELNDLDSIVALCKIKNKKLYLDRTKSPANQIVD